MLCWKLISNLVLISYFLNVGVWSNVFSAVVSNLLKGLRNINSSGVSLLSSELKNEYSSSLEISLFLKKKKEEKPKIKKRSEARINGKFLKRWRKRITECNSPQYTCSLPWGRTGSAAGRRAAPGKCAPWRASLSAPERGRSEARSQAATLFMGPTSAQGSTNVDPPQRHRHGPPSSPLTSNQLGGCDEGEMGTRWMGGGRGRVRERLSVDSWKTIKLHDVIVLRQRAH